MNKPPIAVHGAATGWIENGTHVFPLRVYYEDTDAAGIVYYATYMRFIERGRSEYLRAADVLHREIAAGAVPLAWAVKRMTVEYIKPAHLDDELHVRTRPTDIGGARIKLVQEVRRGEQILLTAEVEVCLVSDGRPQRIPPDIRARLEAIAR
jgi:acyl-CoA thioester hydrolase